MNKYEQAVFNAENKLERMREDHIKSLENHVQALQDARKEDAVTIEVLNQLVEIYKTQLATLEHLTTTIEEHSYQLAIFQFEEKIKLLKLIMPNANLSGVYYELEQLKASYQKGEILSTDYTTQVSILLSSYINQVT